MNTSHLSSIPPHRRRGLAVPQTLTSHSWGKVHHHIRGHLIITQNPRFWEQSHENIAALPFHLKVKYMYLTEHWDGICCFSWPKEAHSLLAGVPWKRRWEWKQPYWTHSFKCLQWFNNTDVNWSSRVKDQGDYLPNPCCEDGINISAVCLF